ncbi:hypothetical protein XfasM23_1065 [Xylella fastidiosa M23]|nr:hypothetical protein XfasM23_1065 [Xylella fastidiosa M23]
MSLKRSNTAHQNRVGADLPVELVFPSNQITTGDRHERIRGAIRLEVGLVHGHALRAISDSLHIRHVSSCFVDVCVDVALGFSDFPNIHRIGLPANPRLKSNSSNKSFRAFTCDRGGRLQKSGKAGLDDRPPQMDKRVRKEAPHSEVKKVPFSRRIGHLLPVGCGGSAEDVWAKIVTRNTATTGFIKASRQCTIKSLSLAESLSQVTNGGIRFTSVVRLFGWAECCEVSTQGFHDVNIP